MTRLKTAGYRCALALAGVVLGLPAAASAQNVQTNVGSPGSVSWNTACVANSPTAPQVPVGTVGLSVCPAAVPASDCLLRVTIPSAQFPDASCNDGSPGTFYIRMGRGNHTRKWIIWLQGGGNCRDGTSCLERWCGQQGNLPYTANKMSSDWDNDGVSNLRPRGLAEGIFNRTAFNDFSDWNHVFVYYCSSDSWMGQADDVPYTSDSGTSFTLNHRGHDIVEAVREMLRNPAGWRPDYYPEGPRMQDLDAATDIIFAGTSAGAKGAIVNADFFLDPFRATARTYLVLDANMATAQVSSSSHDLWVDEDQDDVGDTAFWLKRLEIERDSWAAGGYYNSINGFADESCRSFYTTPPFDSLEFCAHFQPLLQLAPTGVPLIETDTFVRVDLQDPLLARRFSDPWPEGGERMLVGKVGGRHATRDDFIDSMHDTMEFIHSWSSNNVSGVFGPRCTKHVGLMENTPFANHETPNTDSTPAPPVSIGAPLNFHDALSTWVNVAGAAVTNTRVLDTNDVGDPTQPDGMVAFSAIRSTGALCNAPATPRVGINGAACSFLSIREAVNASSPGDNIYVSPGTYREDTISMSSTTLTIAASDANCSAPANTDVNIEPNNSNRIFDIDSTYLVLDGLVIRGGGSTINEGSIVRATNVSTLTMSDTTIHYGQTLAEGGCGYFDNSNLFMSDGSTIHDCVSSDSGGAVYMTNGGSLVMFSGTTIRDSSADDQGGGAYLAGVSAQLRGDIKNNSASDGGGIYATVSGATASDIDVFDSATFQDNKATGNGGGIAAEQSAVDMLGTGLGTIQFLRNEAGANGGGVYLNDSTVDAMFMKFEANVADNAGGAVSAQGGTTGLLRNGQYLSNEAGAGGGGGVYLIDSGTHLKIRSHFADCDPTVLATGRFCSEFRSNTTTGTGGGIKVIAQAKLTLRTSSFVANDSPLNGEAVMVYSNMPASPSDSLIVNCLFIDHQSTSVPAVAGTNSELDVRSCTFSNNTYPVAYLTGSTGPFHRNIVWGNTNDAITTGISGDCNVTQTAAGQPAGVNNTLVDPLFDAGNTRSPFKLLAASTSINACAIGPSFGLDSTSRPVGGAFDRGAFEMP